MSDPAPPPEPTPTPAPPAAQLQRPRVSFVWIIPLLAALIALYLGYRTIMSQGPLLLLTFDSAEGLTAGQTQVKYKYLALGTVESIDLSNDNRHVIVRVRMTNVGARFLTSHARFWVVKPDFSGGDISGLDTLVSGAFIAVDPGQPGGTYRTAFTGLEEPPGVRSDEPGSTFTLKAENLGALNSGSPVFYRDVAVGEVLSYDIGNGLGPISVTIFVRAPFDQLIKPQSHFWNASGITATLGGGSFQIQVQSLKAVFTGAIAFDLPATAIANAPAPANSIFPLYPTADDANSAGYSKQIPLVTYFSSSVSGLTRGAAVQILGIQVGEVTDVGLILDPQTGIAKVRVAMTLQPERIFRAQLLPSIMAMGNSLQDLVDHGLRVQLATANYVTGQQILSLINVKGEPHIKVEKEGDAYVIPSEPGLLDNSLATFAVITAKLAKIPFDQIGNNLNKLLLTTNHTIASAPIARTLSDISTTLKTANTTLGSLSQGYGTDSDFQRSLQQLLSQANDTLRSLDLLSTYLDRHPESLLLGRSPP